MKKGKIPFTRTASDEEYWEKLKQKLKEEIDEFLENENHEELADILEVINSIADFKNLKKEEIENLRKKKFKERGGFEKKIILDKID